jgi:hypothetical protein
MLSVIYAEFCNKLSVVKLSVVAPVKDFFRGGG